MKIRSLKIRGFRGFNEEINITLTPGLNLVYAPNGWGKSSLSEAIEWAIFGNTQRTIDAKSKIEFEGSYRNVHFDLADTVCVGMSCEKKYQKIDLLREMDSTGETAVSVIPDSFRLPDTWLVRPIIYQHALQRFIHTEPKKRWDEFADILGLGELERLRDTLVKVKNSKENATPDEAKQFISKLSQIRTKIESFDQLKDLEKLSQSNAAALTLGAVKMGEHIVEAEVGNKDKLVSELTRILKKKQNAIFDVSIFSLKALDELSEQQYENDKKYITAFNKNALENIKEYRSEKKDELDSRRLNFIKSGLDLLLHHSNVCPFCGEHTITDKLKQELNKEVEASSKTGTLHEKILNALSQVKSKIENISNHFIPKLQNAPDVQDQITKIRELLGDNAKNFVDSLEQAVKQIINESKELASIKETANNAVDSIQSHFDIIKFDETFISNQIASIELLIKKADAIKDNLSFYESQYTGVKERLESKMSKREDIAVPELIIEVLTCSEDISKAFLVEGYIEQIDDLRKKVEKFHKQKTAEKLQEKKDDIQKWYEILNPNEDVGFTGIREHRSRKRWLEILAQSYGEEMSGPACLSESHLNAVGISVYLGQILGTDSPLQFIVIDDPVQSMDEKHSTRFGDIIGEILKEGYQVIILSHQNNIIDMLRIRFQDDPDFGDLEVIKYDKSGPKVEERIPQFQSYLEQAKKFKAGNATCRAASFNFLRKAAERLSKEVYMKGKNVPLSRRYEKLDVEKMEKLLVDSGIPNYQEIAGMKETLKFSGPPSHDDMTRNPPTPEELERHISRLENNWEKWI
jgi:DNA repair exonuclease SbcCD ATPase subunit